MAGRDRAIPRAFSRGEEQDEKGEKEAEAIYDQLIENGIEVLYDDREIGAGQKFADADLIGCPFRVVVMKNVSGK